MIENFRAVVEGEIGVRKELFFGPNGGGKSSIIRAVGLFYRGGAIYSEDVRWGADRAVVEEGDLRLVIPAEGKPRWEWDDRRGEVAWGEFAPPWRDYMPLFLPDGHFFLVERERGALKWAIVKDLADALTEELATRLETAGAVVSPLLERVFPREDGLAVRWGGRWLRFDELSLGLRLGLELVARVESALIAKEALGRDVVVAVECFDCDKHYDLALDLLEYLGRASVGLLVETHTALIVRAALRRGWSVYYVDGRVQDLTEERLKDVGLFRREYEAYARA